MSKKYQTMKKAIKMEIKEHRKSFLVYLTLRALVILVMILQIFNRNFENVFLCLLTLILLIVPSFLQVELKIELPTALEIIILLFIFSAEILGEIQSFYIPFLCIIQQKLTNRLLYKNVIVESCISMKNRHKTINFCPVRNMIRCISR